jgi:hypothetical protein
MKFKKITWWITALMIGVIFWLYIVVLFRGLFETIN